TLPVTKESGYFRQVEAGEAEGLFPGPLRAVFIDSPEAGTWTAEVSADSLPDTVSNASFMLITMLRAKGFKLTAVVPEIATPRGDPMPIRAVLKDGTKGVPGAQVKAMVLAPDSSEYAVLLRDDGASPDSIAGDGIYSGILKETRMAGEYGISI